MAEKVKKVMILIDHAGYKSGDVVELQQSDAELLVKEGIADDNKGAVDVASN